MKPCSGYSPSCVSYPSRTFTAWLLFSLIDTTTTASRQPKGDGPKINFDANYCYHPESIKSAGNNLIVYSPRCIELQVRIMAKQGVTTRWSGFQYKVSAEFKHSCNQGRDRPSIVIP